VEETAEERRKRLGRERTARSRAAKKTHDDNTATIRITISDKEAWQEILWESGVSRSMSLIGGTLSYIDDKISKFRRAQADEDLKNIQPNPEYGEGGVTTGYLESQQPPEPVDRKGREMKITGWRFQPGNTSIPDELADIADCMAGHSDEEIAKVTDAFFQKLHEVSPHLCWPIMRRRLRGRSGQAEEADSQASSNRRRA